MIISPIERHPYYEAIRKRLSLSMEILTLQKMKSLFRSALDPKPHFVGKEIVISGYFTKGDEIASYLNSLSGNMCIGYELENRRDMSSFLDVECYSSSSNEVIATLFKISILEATGIPKEKIYLASSSKEQKRLLKTIAPEIQILPGFVCPPEGKVLLLHFAKEDHSKEKEASLRNLLLSENLSSVSFSEEVEPNSLLGDPSLKLRCKRVQ